MRQLEKYRQRRFMLKQSPSDLRLSFRGGVRTEGLSLRNVARRLTLRYTRLSERVFLYVRVTAANSGRLGFRRCELLKKLLNPA